MFEYFLTKKDAKRGFRNAFGSINEDFYRLIPKALAFKPIADVKEFIYQNILEEKENVSFIFNSVAEGFESENGNLTAVNIKNTETGEISSKAVDGVFVAIGLVPATGFLKDSGVLDAFYQAEKVWQGVRYAIKSFCHCGEEQMSQMAERAMDIYNRHRANRLRRLDAAEQLSAFVSEIEDFFTPEELADSFLAYWIERLKTVSSEYADLFHQRLERNAQRVYFTHQSKVVFERFHNLYLALYVAIMQSDNEDLEEVFRCVNTLIARFTTIWKARKTRIYNANHNIISDDEAISDEEAITSDEAITGDEAISNNDNLSNPSNPSQPLLTSPPASPCTI